MEVRKIVILDPVGISASAKIALNPRPTQIEGLRVGMLDNTKPNFDLFLDVVEESLLNNYHVASVHRYRKPGRTVPVDPAVMAEIKEKCDIVITGLGD